MNIMTAIRADVQRQSRADCALVTQIAERLADENREDVCQSHVNLAEEFMAMVRESDRELRKGAL